VEKPTRNVRMSSEPHASEQDKDFVREALALHNVAVTQDAYYSPLAIFLRDERGAILGGALGDIYGGWLHLTFLWVAEPLRGRGHGRQLLEAAEEEASAQGCRGVHLSTHSFQARPFYERFGYEIVGEIPDNPAGHSLFFLKKALRGSEPG
jgi:GNAT superfamily N-acetyltransferase